MVDNYEYTDVLNVTRRIDHALIFYSDISLTINTNKNVKKGRANGIMVRSVSTKLKKCTTDLEELG